MNYSHAKNWGVTVLSSAHSQSIKLLTANGVELKFAKKYEFTPGLTTFTYKYESITQAANISWSMLFLFTGILPGAAVYGITYAITDSKNPIHTVTANLEANKFYNFDFYSPNFDKNNVTAKIIEVDAKGNLIKIEPIIEAGNDGQDTINLNVTESNLSNSTE